MGDSFQVDAAQLHRHASKVQGVIDQLAAIKGASQAIAQNDAAYGMLCQWMSGILERRHREQEELYASVEENLRLAADAITVTGREYEAADEAARGRILQSGQGLT